MTNKAILRAWRHYRRESLRSLIKQIDKRFRGLIPFRYRISFRIIKQRHRWGNAAITNPLRVVFVDPHQIQYSGPRFDRIKHIGTVQAGDWDQNVSEWGGSRYSSLYNRFINKYEWENTEYYHKAKRKIAQEGYYLGYTDFETFKNQRLSYLDQLFEDIRGNGYKTQSELNKDNWDTNRHQTISRFNMETHEIGCNIARDGRLLFNSGNHRLCIAKILDLDEIPIQIIARHESWMKKRKHLITSNCPNQILTELNINTNNPDIKEFI